MNGKKTVNAFLEFIDSRICENIDMSVLERKSGYSARQLNRFFVYYTGLSVMKYVVYRKVCFALCELAESGGRVIDAAYKYGFESPDVFTRCCKRYFGSSPVVIRKSHSLETAAPVYISPNIYYERLRSLKVSGKPLSFSVPLVQKFILIPFRETLIKSSFSFLIAYVGRLSPRRRRGESL